MEHDGRDVDRVPSDVRKTIWPYRISVWSGGFFFLRMRLL